MSLIFKFSEQSFFEAFVDEAKEFLFGSKIEYLIHRFGLDE